MTQNMEPLIMAATSAIAAQQAAWQAAILSMIMLGLNMLILVLVIWVAYKFDQLEKHLAMKDAAQSEKVTT